MNTQAITCVTPTKCLLGEGPVWDEVNQLLYWVDILNCNIYCYDPKTKATKSWKTKEYVGFVIVQKNGSFIGGLKSGLHFIVLNDDGSTTATRIDTVDEGLSHIRYNDGMQDEHGGIWACTMDMRCKEPSGKYFYYNQQLQRTTVAENYIVGNGPALNRAKSKLYTVETIGGKNNLSRGIYASEISDDKTLVNTKLLVDWKQWGTYPDGITTDVAGNIWAGEFGGNTLRCFSSDGKLKQSLLLPALNVTKAVFADEKTLYVTSAILDVDEQTVCNYPLTGGVLQIDISAM